MKGLFKEASGKLVYRCESELLSVEAWGKNSLRIRCTHEQYPTENCYALLDRPAGDATITLTNDAAEITNGKLTAKLNENGELSFYHTESGKLLLKEYHRMGPLKINGREFKAIIGGKYKLTARFESDPKEKLYGMGQYQQDTFDLKGSALELAQRNTQASVPFVLSSEGYGFLWNNPAIGEAVFGKNMTLWRSEVTDTLDYLMIAGDSPAEIEEAYMTATGKPPMMPRYAMGFWQSKLRYRTQDELMAVARKYRDLGIPLSVIVVDYYFFPADGDWRFDEKFFPDPDGMIRELEEMGTKLMVSVWPAVDDKSENHREMRMNGYLVKSDRPIRNQLPMGRPLTAVDVSNPDAMAYMWKKLKSNYYDKGVRIFWLDCIEPEYYMAESDLFRYALGTHLEVGNIFPLLCEKGVYEGMRDAGQEEILNLCRCAWAGSQRYGSLVWSGDVPSTFESLRTQIVAGLQMSIAGIPWWTTDIGGFIGGNIHDEVFKECLIRWFEYGTFCPVMRLHGDRRPAISAKECVPSGKGIAAHTGADNEIWSYGTENFEIMKKHIFYREEMKPYIETAMKKAHEHGTPPMRPLFYDFPNDKAAWDISDEYLFGTSLLVCPVTEYGVRSRKVYLPAGAEWVDAFNGTRYAGGTTIQADAPLEHIPVFVRA